MDPDVLLSEIREAYREAIDLGELDSPLVNLASKIQDLDEWLTRGGFHPRPWARS